MQPELRLFELNKRLSLRPEAMHTHPQQPLDPADVAMWYEAFANEFFDDSAKLTMRNVNDVGAFSSPHLLDNSSGETKTFTIGRHLVPRFWRSFGEGGCVELQLIFAGRSHTSIVPRNPMVHAQIVIHEVEFCTLVSERLIT